MASSQIAYAGSDVVVTLNVIDSTGTHQAATGLNASRLSSHPSAVPVVTNPNSEPGVYVLTWSSLSPATSEGDSIVALIEGSVSGTAFSTYAIPLKVVANERGTDNASTFDNTVDTVITDAASRTASQADVSLLATAASIAALNNFDPATDTVANVTTVASVTNPVATDAASRTASQADVSSLATSASISALNDFDPSTDQVIVATNNDKTGYSLTTTPPTAAEIYTEFVSGSNEDAFKADVTGISAQISALNDLSTTDVENSVWDAAYSSHTTAGTFGKLMDILRKANRAIEGQVAGTPTSSSFDTDLIGYTSGAFDHETLVFLSGALEGEARPILSYDATNGRITFEEALTAAPSASDEFAILPFHVHPISEIVDGIFNEPQSGYTTAGTFGYYLDSQISAAGGAVDTGAIADAVWDEQRSPDHVTAGSFGYYLDAQVSSAGAGGTGLYQVTVIVQNEDGDRLQGARINVDGTTLTLVSDSSGECVFNLDSGIYLLEMSPPANYQTPVGNTITVTASDISSTFTLTATAPSGDCDIPWVG